MNDVELVWKNKKTQIEKVSLPFQKIEEVNLSRASKGTLLPELRGNEEALWKNKLIWGDNKYIINSLLKDSAIAGKIKLIYIDPPFFTGTNMNININIGNKAELTKQPSAIEEVAYRNMWKDGPSSFFQYMYDRFALIRDLLSDDGLLWVRFDVRYVHYIKVILDKLFGYDNFINEITINKKRESIGSVNKFEDENEYLLVYRKTNKSTVNNLYKERDLKDFKWTGFLKQEERNPPERVFLGIKLYPPKGQHFSLVQEKVNKLLGEHFLRLSCKKCSALYYYDKNNSKENFIKEEIMKSKEWFKFNDIKPSMLIYGVESITKCLNCESKEFRVQYLPSDKIKVTNNWKDIPSYSSRTGYPTENSEQLLERVILTSSNKNDIVADFFGGSGTTAAVAEKLDRRWIICDIGRFSIHTMRKRFLEIPTCKPFEVLNMGKYERQQWISEATKGDYRSYIFFILQLYGSKSLDNFSFINGKKGNKAVHVGPLDSPVLKSEIYDTLKECKNAGFIGLDILGWEWELSLNDLIIKEAKDDFGINLSLKTIPREVMDKRATDAGDIQFYELAYLKTNLENNKNGVKIKLDEFVIPNVDELPKEVRAKVKHWSDYIDYWAVDWDFTENFHNEWQTYRTRQDKNLELETPVHAYNRKGKHRIMIKVIDIFGNDTSTIKDIMI